MKKKIYRLRWFKAWAIVNEYGRAAFDQDIWQDFFYRTKSEAKQALTNFSAPHLWRVCKIIIKEDV